MRSTERAAELGDQRWRELLEQHHALVRRELARYRGQEVDTAGDGFFASLAGIAVHTGARVAAEAGPGEVLVSQTVKDLVTGSGLGFEDRGTRELKGLPGEWRLYEVAL